MSNASKQNYSWCVDGSWKHYVTSMNILNKSRKYIFRLRGHTFILDGLRNFMGAVLEKITQ